jgi:glycosyltransferase involved in cell wall biosynthesis
MSAPRIPPAGSPLVDATILICTYNRAGLLADTLHSLAALRPGSGLSWEVLVVDNNSTDGTRDVVERRRGSFPVALRYIFEPVQGKSTALNTGILASRARVIVFTDDDVRTPAGWLGAAVEPLLARADIDYTGGPVRPIWGRPRPAWLDERGNLGGTIAVKDHGPAPFIFEEMRKTPLGVNLAVRRSLIERIGGFRPDLGRNAKSLLGQEQADFFYRSRRAGARGLYVPEMVLSHIVPAERLTRSYFRRWWYWKGISHARIHGIHGETELGLDLSSTPRIGGVPRFVFGDARSNLLGWARTLLSGDRPGRAEHGLMLAYFAGYLRESRRAAGTTGTSIPVGESSQV